MCNGGQVGCAKSVMRAKSFNPVNLGKHGRFLVNFWVNTVSSGKSGKSGKSGGPYTTRSDAGDT